MSPFGPCAPVSPLSPLSPLGPCGPTSPFSPLGPTSPCGPVKPVSPFSPLGPVKVPLFSFSWNVWPSKNVTSSALWVWFLFALLLSSALVAYPLKSTSPPPNEASAILLVTNVSVAKPSIEGIIGLFVKSL